MQTALFIGRFQPFHKGHLSVIKKIYPLYERIIIGIGSSEDNYLPANPFTANERYEMIYQALAAEKFDLAKIAIIPVRNINNYALWVRHVEITLPNFQHVYTGSSIVRNLFEQSGKYTLHNVPDDFEINATQVRNKILKQTDYYQLVPDSVFEFLQKIDATKRLRDIEV